MTTTQHEIEIVTVENPEEDKDRMAHLSCGVCYAMDKILGRDHKAVCGHVFPKGYDGGNWTTKCVVCQDLEPTHPHFLLS